jgi:hypothetical protein
MRSIKIGSHIKQPLTKELASPILDSGDAAYGQELAIEFSELRAIVVLLGADFI